MLTELDETLHHQASLTFDHVNTTDHRFYDRQLMGGFQPDGGAAFLGGITLFKNMNVIEGFALVQAHGRTQYNLRFTQQLRPMSGAEARIGPLSITVVKPFHELRLTLEPSAHPIAFDITFRDVLPPRLENPHVDRLDGRLHTDYLRYHQLGSISGWIEAAGERFDARSWFGWRDHSWGVRPGVGGFEPLTGTRVGGGVASRLAHRRQGSVPDPCRLLERAPGRRHPADRGWRRQAHLHRRRSPHDRRRRRSRRRDRGPVDRAQKSCSNPAPASSSARGAGSGPGRRQALGIAGTSGRQSLGSIAAPAFDGGFTDGKGQGVWRSQELLTESDSYDVSDPELVVMPDGSNAESRAIGNSWRFARSTASLAPPTCRCS